MPSAGLSVRSQGNPSPRTELAKTVGAETRRGLELAIIDLEEHGEIDEVGAQVLRRARHTLEQILGNWFPPEAQA